MASASVNLDVHASGQAAKALKDMAGDARMLGSVLATTSQTMLRSEADYQGALKESIGLIKQQINLQNEIRQHFEAQQRASPIWQQQQRARELQTRQTQYDASQGRYGDHLQKMGGMMMGGAEEIVKMVAKAYTGSLQWSAHAADTMSDSTLSSRQRQERVSESIPLLGGIAKSVREFGEAVNGVTDRLRRNAIDMDRFRTLQPIAAGMLHQTDVMGQASYAGVARGRALGGMASPNLGPSDRTTVAGEFAFQRFEMTSPARERERMAQTEVQAAVEAEKFAGGALRKGITDRNAAAGAAAASKMDLARMQMQEKELYKGSGPPTWMTAGAMGVPGGLTALAGLGSGLELMGFSGSSSKMRARGQMKGDVLTAQSGLSADKQKLVDAEERVLGLMRLQTEAANATLQARKQAGQAGVETSRAELEYAKMRTGLATTQARTLGGMGVMDRELGISSLQMSLKFGRDQVTDEMWQRAKGLAPHTIGKMEEQGGEVHRARMRGMAAQMGHAGLAEEFKGTLAERRAEEYGLSSKVKVDTQDNAVRFGEAIGTELARFTDAVIAQMAKQFSAQTASFNAKMQERFGAK